MQYWGMCSIGNLNIQDKCSVKIRLKKLMYRCVIEPKEGQINENAFYRYIVY